MRIGNEEYKVIINRKRIKNAYIRVNDKLEIVVSANRLIPMFEINRLLENNTDAILKMINIVKHKKQKETHFYFMGSEYDVIINDSFFDVDHVNKKIYAKDIKEIDKYIKKYITSLFEERLKHNFDIMNLGIKYPVLKLRKMKTRWGVCNRRTHSITLNTELYKYSIKEIDYVIIHELSHFKYFDHSKNFWNFVSIYEPDYKKTRKTLKQ